MSSLVVNIISSRPLVKCKTIENADVVRPEPIGEKEVAGQKQLATGTEWRKQPHHVAEPKGHAYGIRPITAANPIFSHKPYSLLTIVPYSKETRVNAASDNYT